MKALLSCLALLCVFGCTEGEPLVGKLRVCLAPNDLPRADRASSTGFDMDVARLIAEHLSMSFVPVWLPPPDRTEIEVSDANYSLLITGKCDLQLSTPGGTVPGPVVLSAPYYGTAFELIPEDAQTDLVNWEGAKFAVRSNSIAHILVDRYGLPWTMKRETAEIVASVRSGEAEAALVWGPDLATLDATSRATFSTAFIAPSVLKWNQHMATRASDTALLEDINTLLSSEKINRKIQGLLARHHIPVHAPFTETFRTSDLKELD